MATGSSLVNVYGVFRFLYSTLKTENQSSLQKQQNTFLKLVEEFGSDVWFEREAKDLLPEGFTHPSSPNGTFTKEMDIMDVWFDSGSSHAGVLGIRPRINIPS